MRRGGAEEELATLASHDTDTHMALPVARQARQVGGHEDEECLVTTCSGGLCCLALARGQAATAPSREGPSHGPGAVPLPASGVSAGSPGVGRARAPEKSEQRTAALPVFTTGTRYRAPRERLC